MKIKNLLAGVAIISILGSSCVSTQKYKDIEKARDHYKAENANLKSLEKENTELTNKLRVAENQLGRVREEAEQFKAELDRIKKDHLSLVSDYNKATEDSRRILQEYSTDKRDFDERLGNTQEELLRRERQLEGLESALGVQEYSIESMRKDLDTREKRVVELEKMLAEKDAQMEKLRNSLSSALQGYAAGDLSVAERNGKIYVTLSQQLLFKTNSDKVDPKGEQALVQVAKALAGNPDIHAIVEGHTDNTGSVDYNWDLSTRRATAVVKILSFNGVAPARLTAAGKGMHYPVVPNTTEENRAKNRRTEIILSPNLDKLFELTK
jgi:chemotaxis protein MotB